MIPITDLNWGFVEIIYLIIVFAIGFIVTLLIIPYIIRFMKVKGYTGRDIHKNARPEVAESGGVSIVIGFFVASILLILFFPIFINEIIIFTLTVILTGIIGFIDDMIKLRSRYKILLTIFAGSLFFVANYFGFIHIVSPTIPFLGKLRLTIIYPFIVPIIIAIFGNSVNMLEGYNGEGSGTCLIAVCFLFICGLIWNSAEAILFTSVVIAVLIPFYLYNKYPAKIFPGDIGTLSIGVMIAGIALFGSLEVAAFCALLIHIFNSFYVLYSVRGFFESAKIQQEKGDVILLIDDRIKASEKKNAVLTLPRLILAKGPLKEPELIKNLFSISFFCGFFSVVATLLMVWTIGTIEMFVIIVAITILLIPSIFLLVKFPRIRGIIIMMMALLIGGIFFLIFADLFIIPLTSIEIDLILLKVPLNIIISLFMLIPGFIFWYFISLKYFWMQINKMKNKEVNNLYIEDNKRD